jgi:photosystem II stability/assembly factor-like uncharacterized protein
METDLPLFHQSLLKVRGLTWWVLLSVLFSACVQEDKVSLAWVQVDNPLDDDLNAVAASGADPQLLFAAGGIAWERGCILRSEDNGESWDLDTTIRVELHDMAFSAEGDGRQVGKAGNYLFSSASPPAWHFVRLNYWDNLNAVDINEQEVTICGGGSAWENGYIWRLNPDHQLIQADTFTNEITAVCFSDSFTVHAAGYGLVLRSTDAGLSWEASDLRGDHFRDIHFPSPQTGFLIGAGGMIARTRNSGENWDVIRKGGISWGKAPGFRAVYFISPERGYICGDEGLLWTTVDGGESWQKVEGLPQVDLMDIYISGNWGIVVGEAGLIIRFSI